MEELFQDRFSGKLFDQLPTGRTIPGRWQLRVPPGRNIVLNSVPAKFGDFLVPELSGNWRVIDAEGSAHQGKMSRKLDPKEVEADSIRTIGRHLDRLIKANATWLEWLDVVPLVPGMSDAIDLLPLEHQIREFFGHLATVCMKPKAHLHVEVERVPLVKARRLPIKAASYLASHTEDWERPLIRGVLPKRILSEAMHDQVDIYENRVAARLIDHLVIYTGKRIRVIRKLLKVFQDKEDYSSAVGGTYLRQRRILELWGQSIDANEGRKKAEATLKELEWLKYRLMGLMDSPLYRDVPRRTFVAPTLRTTNILTNDQNYRRVAELWRAWVDAGHGETETPVDVYREAQEQCCGITNFSMLLVVRALDQLGYEICEQDIEAPVTAPGQWVLQGHGTTAVCEWDEAGRVSILMGGNRIAVVAIPANLSAGSSEELVCEVLDQAVAAIDERIGRTIILYAGDIYEPRQKLSLLTQRRIHTVGNDPRSEQTDKIGLLPVSPWDIGSVERVSRAIRWFTDSSRFSCYPLVIRAASDLRDILDAGTTGTWLELTENGEKITIRRPPQESEWRQLNLDQVVVRAEEAHRDALAEHKRISEELHEAVRRGRTGTLNQQKKDAHQRTITARDLRYAVVQLKEDLAKAVKETQALLVCPACGTEADPEIDFEPRGNGTFRCECRECGTHWETRTCSHGHRYPVMLPGSFREAEETEVGWEDQVYGGDLLALPARTANGTWGFVCSECGETS